MFRWMMGEGDHPDREFGLTFYDGHCQGLGSWSSMVSVWNSSTVAMLRRDIDQTIKRCDDGIAMSIAGGYGLGVPYMTVNRGWAIAANGDAETGLAAIVEGAAVADAFGARYMRPVFSALRSEAAIMAGELE